MIPKYALIIRVGDKLTTHLINCKRHARYILDEAADNDLLDGYRLLSSDANGLIHPTSI
jgi:hypothetical protein